MNKELKKLSATFVDPFKRASNPFKAVENLKQLVERVEAGSVQERQVVSVCSMAVDVICTRHDLDASGYHVCCELLVYLVERCAHWAARDLGQHQPEVYKILVAVMNDMNMFYSHCDPAQKSQQTMYSGEEENDDNDEDIVGFAEVDGKYASGNSVGLDESEVMCVAVNAFGEQGGFDVVLQLLEATEELPSLFSVPWIIYGMVSLVPRLHAPLASEYIERIFRGASALVLEHFSEADIKIADDSACPGVIQQLTTLIKGSRKDLQPELELLNLNWADRLIRLPLLQKRICGLGMLVEFLQNVSNSERFSHNRYQHMRVQTTITTDSIGKWLVESKVVEYLYGEGLHTELLSRCRDIPCFLASKSMLTETHMDFIWSSCRGQHDSIIQELLQLIPELTAECSIKELTYLFEKMRSVPVAELEESFLRVILAFTPAAVARHLELQHGGEPCWYGLEILWNIVHTTGSPLAPGAQAGMLELFNNRSFYIQRVPYMEKCIENLRSRHSVPASLALLAGIIQSYPEGSFHDDNQSKAIEWLNKKHTLLEVLFQELLLANAQDSAGIKARIDFLHFLLTNSPLELNTDQLRSLWNTLIVKAPSSQDREKSFRWFSTTTRGFFSQNACEALFIELFPSLPIHELSPQAVNCFRSFFYSVNTATGALIRRSNDVTDVVVTSTEPQGVNFLWQIAFHAPKIQSDQALQLLVALQGRLGGSLTAEQVIESRHSFIRQCVSNLDAGAASVTALNMLIESLPLASSAGGAPPITLTVKAVSKSLPDFQISLQGHTQLFAFRKAICERYKLNPGEIRLISSGKELKDDFASLNSLQLGGGNCVVHVVKKPGSSTSSSSRSTKPAQEVMHITDRKAAPSVILSRPEYLEPLLNAMDSAESHLAAEIWSLTTKLPYSEQTLQTFQSLNNGSPEWDLLLNSTSVNRLLYALGVCLEILEQDSTGDWQRNFFNLGGLAHLGALLSNGTFFSAAVGANGCEAFSSLLQLSSVFCLDESGDWPVLLSDFMVGFLQPKALFERLMTCIQFVCAHAPPELDQDRSYILLTECAKVLVALARQTHELFSVSRDWVTDSLLVCPSKRNRQLVCDALRTISQIHGSSVASPLGALMLDIFPVVQNHGERSTFYFDLLGDVIRFSGREPSSFSDLVRLLANNVMTSPIIEQRYNKDLMDNLLCGSMNLLTTLLEQLPDLCLELYPSLMPHIFHDCLMKNATLENHGPHAPPKCKLKSSRAVAYKLLTELASCGPDAYLLLTSLLYQQQIEVGNSNVPLSIGRYSPNEAVRSDSGYVGLQNLGATCYMNSLSQNLFMVPEFRRDLLSCNPADVTDEENRTRLMEFQTFFAHLQESECQAYNTRNYVDAFGINPGIQQDVDEYLIQLFDTIETITKGGEYENLNVTHFGGTIINQVISQECEHISEREEAFQTISVDVKGKSGLQESLESYILSDLLSGDNKYHCSDCDAKVDAKKRSVLGDLPDTLIITLKRFAFNFETFVREKVNTRFEFPDYIDFLPYTKLGLAKQEYLKIAPEDERPEDYFKFRLSGIIVHSGTTEMGHYYAFVKERVPSNPGETLRWISFNDSDVEDYDPKSIPAGCFGGAAQSGSYSMREKHYSAYMLFYERVSVEHDVNYCQTSHKNVNAELLQSVWQSNTYFLTHIAVFDMDYFEFVWNLVEETKNAPACHQLVSPADDRSLKSIQLAFTFLLNTFIYSKDNFRLEHYIKTLTDMLMKHVPGAKWFLEALSANGGLSWFKNCIVRNGSDDARTFLITCVKAAMDTVNSSVDTDVSNFVDEEAPLQPKNSIAGAAIARVGGQDTPTSCCMALFIDVVMRRVLANRSVWRKSFAAWGLVQHFLSFGARERDFFLFRGYEKLTLDYYLGDESLVRFNKPARAELVSKEEDFEGGPMFSCIAELIANECNCSEEFNQMMELPVLWERLLRDCSGSPDVIAKLCNSMPGSAISNILEVAFSYLKEAHEDAMDGGHAALSAILTRYDSQVAEILWNNYKEVIVANHKFPACLSASLKWLGEAVSKFPSFASQIISEKSLANWVIPLLFHPKSRIRTECARLLLMAGDEEMFSALLNVVLNNAHRFSPKKLLSFSALRTKEGMRKHKDGFKLVQAFELLAALLNTEATSENFRLCLDMMCPTFESVFAHSEIECNYDQLAFVKLLEKALKQPRILQAMSSEDSLQLLNPLFTQLAIITRSQEPTLSFVNELLKRYYNVIFLLVQNNPTLCQLVANDSTFLWVMWRVYMCESDEYSDCSPQIKMLFEYLCGNQQFRDYHLAQGPKEIDDRVPLDYLSPEKLEWYYTALVLDERAGCRACLGGSMVPITFVVSAYLKNNRPTKQILDLALMLVRWMESASSEELERSRRSWSHSRRCRALKFLFRVYGAATQNSADRMKQCQQIILTICTDEAERPRALDYFSNSLQNDRVKFWPVQLIHDGQSEHPAVKLCFDFAAQLIKLGVESTQPIDQTHSLKLCVLILQTLPSELFDQIPVFCLPLQTLAAGQSFFENGDTFLPFVEKVLKNPVMLLRAELTDVFARVILALANTIDDEDKHVLVTETVRVCESHQVNTEQGALIVLRLVAVMCRASAELKQQVVSRVAIQLGEIEKAFGASPEIAQLLEQLK